MTSEDKKFRNLWVALIAVLIIAITGLFTPWGKAVVQAAAEKAGSVSGVSNYSKLGVKELKIGSGCDDGFTYSGSTCGAGFTFGVTTATGWTLSTAAGVDIAVGQFSFNTSTSSTLVIVANPYTGATTTVDDLVILTTSSVTGSNTYDVSTSTNCTSSSNSSSTPAFVYAHAVPSGALDYMAWSSHTVASTTVSVPGSVYTSDGYKDGSSPFQLAPSQCLAVRVASSSPGTFSGGFWTGTISVRAHKP